MPHSTSAERAPLGNLKPGIISPRRPVPAHIDRPEYMYHSGPEVITASDIKTPETIEKIRKAGQIAAQALQAVGEAIRPGVTTDELDRIGHDFIISRDAYPSCLGYMGFPKSLCTSINEVICHGIPDDRPLEDGDIINVESYAHRFNYGVVRDYTGHGVGEAFHSGLIVPHYDTAPAHSEIMEEGMVFTIEPMLNLGGVEWEQWDDQWTVVTKDRGRSAQFEHTIVVTENGAEILTLP